MEKETSIRLKEIKYTCLACHRTHTIPVKGEWFYRMPHYCAYDGNVMDEKFIFEEKDAVHIPKMMQIRITHLDSTIESHKSLFEDMSSGIDTFSFVSRVDLRRYSVHPSRVKKIERWEIINA